MELANTPTEHSPRAGGAPESMPEVPAHIQSAEGRAEQFPSDTRQAPALSMSESAESVPGGNTQAEEAVSGAKADDGGKDQASDGEAGLTERVETVSPSRDGSGADVSEQPSNSEAQNAARQEREEREEREREDREEKMQFLRTSHDLDKPLAPPTKRDPASEPPSAGCPSLVTPSLAAYISDKDKDSLFQTMARGLLEYIGCFPLARKVPIPPKSDDQDNKSKSKEEREREARLRAKAAANKRRDKPQEDKGNKKTSPPPPPPKTEKTAKDFQYAMRRWLERSWKAGLLLTNAFRIGELMEADSDHLLKGQEPILESKLDTVWNGYGFEVKSVPLADVSEWDWRDLAKRLKHQHLIGDKFFPSEEYNPQWGLDAMRVPPKSEEGAAPTPAQASRRASRSASDEAARKRETALAREAVYWNQEHGCWEDSTHVGLSADFAASTQLICWDYDDAGPVVRHPPPTANSQSEKSGSRPSTSLTLAQFADASKKGWVNRRQKSGRNVIGRSISDLSRAEGATRTHHTDMQRSTSEPLTSESVKHAGGKKRRELTEEQRQKQIEDEKAFRRFIKLHTGHTRVSQRKMEECREPFRLYKLQQKRTAAVGYYGGVLDEMEQEFEEIFNAQNEEEDDDEDFMTEEKKQQKALIEQLFPPESLDDIVEDEGAKGSPNAMLDLNMLSKPKEKEKPKPPPMPMAERLRVGSSLMTDIEASFAQRRRTAGKKEVAAMLQTNASSAADTELEEEISFDEFLRRPMKVNLSRDPGLIKSLRAYTAMVGETGLNELEVDTSQQADVRGSMGRPPANFGNKRSTRLPGLRASSGGLGLPQLGHAGMMRSKSSLGHASSSGLDALVMPGGIPRRDGLMSQGGQGQMFSTSGFNISRSPYAQKMPSRPETKRRFASRQSVSGGGGGGSAWQPRFSKIASHADAAHVLAHVPVK